MSFSNTLSKFWYNVQSVLFPMLEKDIGKLSKKYKKLAAILDLVRIEEFITSKTYIEGRPLKDREAIARAYIAKIILKIHYTKDLIEKLNSDMQLRNLCGFKHLPKIPSESTFSRAFNEFAKIKLPERVHQELINKYYKDEVLENVVTDSTPIEAREKHLRKEKVKSKTIKRVKKKKNGELNRRQKQLLEPDLNKMIDDLPIHCDKGMKKSAQGYTKAWKGYKLHVAITDDCIPLSAIVTSASLNDCEVAIPLSKKCKNITNLYDIMDAAYDHPEIKEHSRSLGHIPIIDQCPHSRAQKIEKEAEKSRKKSLRFKTVEDIRYAQRFKTERFNALYKDYYGGRTIVYRGHSKVSCQIMFGLLAITGSIIINSLL